VERVNASGRLPRTYTVLTGRRFAPDDPSKPEWGVQLYYKGAIAGSGHFEEDGGNGDIQSWGDLIMAAGSVHPKSGERYEVLIDAPIAPLPEWVKELQPERKQFDAADAVPDETADAWKTWLLEYAAHYQIELRDFEKRVPNGWLLGIKCPWAHRSGEDGAESSTVLGIQDGKITFKCTHGTCENTHKTAEFKAEMVQRRGDYAPEPGADPVVVFGSAKTHEKFVAPADWRGLFHSKDEVLNCQPPTFLIENFLACQAICAIAAPVGQRKSIIALNVARSLCTGEPLFGFLPVVTRPSRVLYLCPEMGLISLSDRVRNIGVGECLGDTLFLRSMNLGGLDLLDLPDVALQESVLIIDTAIRFMQGDENSAKDMKLFSDVLFNIQRRQGPKGAVIILYHSPKTTRDTFELTLENCLRGSGELGAAVTDAHGTRMQNPGDRWNSKKFISHVKCRDYEGVEDFEVSCDRATAVLTKTGEAGVKAVLSAKKRGPKSNADGIDDAARAFIKARANLTVSALLSGLSDLGIERGRTWVKEARLAIRGGGSKLTE
jgi:hypothetical protein